MPYLNSQATLPLRRSGGKQGNFSIPFFSSTRGDKTPLLSIRVPKVQPHRNHEHVPVSTGAGGRKGGGLGEAEDEGPEEVLGSESSGLRSDIFVAEIRQSVLKHKENKDDDDDGKLFSPTNPTLAPFPGGSSHSSSTSFGCWSPSSPPPIANDDAEALREREKLRHQHALTGFKYRDDPRWRDFDHWQRVHPGEMPLVPCQCGFRKRASPRVASSRRGARAAPAEPRERVERGPEPATCVTLIVLVLRALLQGLPAEHSQQPQEERRQQQQRGRQPPPQHEQATRPGRENSPEFVLFEAIGHMAFCLFVFWVGRSLFGWT